MNDNPLLAVKALGQHVWLDDLSRNLINHGALQHWIDEDGIDGVTSNPSIFQKAIADSPFYQADLERLRNAHLNPDAAYESLVIPDVQAACDILLPTYINSRGEAGYVSLEVSPALANDVAGTRSAALHLSLAVGRDNLLIKVPGTPAGIQSLEQLTAIGIPANVTLLFSLAQYEATAQAYLRGAQRWLQGGTPRDSGEILWRLRSVASVFLSRVDTYVDQQLDLLASEAALALKGKCGVALAKRCYHRYLEIFHGPDFAALAVAGVRPQTLLWASTGSKNPAYGDLLYVEPLIGPETITTLPEATLAAFRMHGHAEPTLTIGMDEAKAHLDALAALGIDLDQVGESLQIDGIHRFAEAYAKSRALPAAVV